MAGSPTGRAAAIAARAARRRRRAEGRGCCTCSGVIEARTGSLREAHRRAARRPSTRPRIRRSRSSCSTRRPRRPSYVGRVDDVAGARPAGDADLARSASATASTSRCWPASTAVSPATTGSRQAFARRARARADALDDPRALIWAANAASVAGARAPACPTPPGRSNSRAAQGLLSLLPLALHRQARRARSGTAGSISRYAAARGGIPASDRHRLRHRLAPRRRWPPSKRSGVATTTPARTPSEALAIGQQSGSQFLLASAELTLALHRADRRAIGRGDRPPARR